MSALTQHLPLLQRYPPQLEDNLQAWDSADEYLLQSLVPSQLDRSRPVLVLGDGFGALSCALSSFKLTSVTDSFVSRKAIEQNLERLGLPGVDIVPPQAPWPQEPQLVLAKIPKQLSLLEYWLAKLKPLLGPDTQVWFAGRDRDIPERAEALLGKYLGPTERLLGWKKARAFFSHSDGKAPLPMPAPLRWPLEGTAFTLTNHANVFSRQSLDIGARLMLANLPEGRFDRVIDLGCGNGVLALAMANRYPEAHYSLVDESYLAVASAEENMAHNLPQVDAHCLANDCLSGFPSVSADLVLCNPPFHQQQAVTDHVAWQMMKDAQRVLRPGGELWLVGNRHLGYHLKLKRLFGGCQVVASDRKFVILKAVKRRSK
ncbi:methyltransferase [Gallaecimonas kandeliae]|uniref:methyltransferase n=1 Tax=Gallaecimonas kandeliae TaxID=3029055 RepID=UPI00264776EA|nr:methyltransferase [Gallaecimonas kandeliae]WKE64895.1 methyltransferase [Gallaecimonas kandeliae]